MSDAASSVTPVAEGIFVAHGSDRAVHLLCSLCICGVVAFPQRHRCAACSGADLTVVEAPSEGVVYSWTTVPGPNPPQIVAQVQLANGLLVQGYVAEGIASVQIGQAVRTCLAPAGYRDDGVEVASFAFEPAVGGP